MNSQRYHIPESPGVTRFTDDKQMRTFDHRYQRLTGGTFHSQLEDHNSDSSPKKSINLLNSPNGGFATDRDMRLTTPALDENSRVDVVSVKSAISGPNNIQHVPDLPSNDQQYSRVYN